MPTASFIHDGNAIDYTPTVDTPAGTVVVQGYLIGITKREIAANEKGALALTGVFEVPVEELASWTVGTKAYWDPGDEWAATDSQSGTLKYMGKAVHVPASGNTIRVRLEQ